MTVNKNINVIVHNKEVISCNKAVFQYRTGRIEKHDDC